MITGSVRTGIEETAITEKRTRCVKKDPADKNKCLKEEEYDLRCRRRVATVSPNVRLVAMGDGSISYSRPLSARDEQSYCPDRKAWRTVKDFVDATLQGQARAIRTDLVPSGYSLDVRVDENRKGLSTPAAEAFKNAIRQTKRPGRRLRQLGGDRARCRADRGARLQSRPLRRGAARL